MNEDQDDESRVRARARARKGALTVAGHTATALALVTLWLVSGCAPAVDEYAFPAVELRTSEDPPGLVLGNQRGDEISLSALEGKVVVLTAVYAECPHTCPLILTQARDAVAELSPEQRAGLRVVAVTMDPGHDSPKVLAELASRHGLAAPLYHFVTGDADEVETLLDEMGIIRERDPETGVIHHANLFLLIDRQGRLAYRLGLGEHQREWLVSALTLLLAEPASS